MDVLCDYVRGGRGGRRERYSSRRSRKGGREQAGEGQIASFFPIFVLHIRESAVRYTRER